MKHCNEPGSDQHCSHGCAHDQESDGSCLRTVPATDIYPEASPDEDLHRSCHSDGTCSCADLPEEVQS